MRTKSPHIRNGRITCLDVNKSESILLMNIAHPIPIQAVAVNFEINEGIESKPSGIEGEKESPLGDHLMYEMTR